MRFLQLLAAAALPALSLAAPTHASLITDTANSRDAVDHLSDYFNLLASKVQRYKVLDRPPVCDVSKTALPVSANTLPPPAKGLSLTHIAIGRGTQNYTCNPANATAPPTAAGAVATLYDASCLDADVLAALSRLSISYEPVPAPLSDSNERPHIGPQAMTVSGVHFFNAAGAPFFDIDNVGGGHIAVALNTSTPAPVDAAVGLGGEKAVGWLKLIAREEDDSATKGLQEVYRLGTVGGSAPASCEGMPEKFEVDYVAQYWFTGSKDD